MKSRQVLLDVKLTLVPLIWGGAFICGRILAQEMPPAASALAWLAIFFLAVPGTAIAFV